MELLKVQNISKKFQTNPVLTNISFSIDPGQFLCLLGPSGSGKTTLLRIIAGLIKPSSGNVIINGKNQENVLTNKRNIGFVFQSPTALFPHLSVIDNVAFSFKHGNRNNLGNIWKDAVYKMLERVRLDVKANDSISTLSGGQKQRVAIARALVYKPALLLLDEPLSSLDNELKKDLLELMKQLHQETGTTFIYVTHDEREAIHVASHIAILDEGHLQQYGTISDVTSNPQSRRVAEIIGGWSFISGEKHESEHSIAILPGNTRFQSEYLIKFTKKNVCIAIPTRNIKIEKEIQKRSANNIYIPGEIVENHTLYKERRIKCFIAEKQIIECAIPVDMPIELNERVLISFSKEDINVFESE